MREVLRVFLCDNGAVVQITDWGDPATKEPCTPCQGRAQVTNVRHIVATTQLQLEGVVCEALANIKLNCPDC